MLQKSNYFLQINFYPFTHVLENLVRKIVLPQKRLNSANSISSSKRVDEYQII